MPPSSVADPATLTELLLRRARDTPERLAFTATEGDGEPVGLTDGALVGRARAVSAVLADATGRPVMVVTPPGLETVVGLAGCFLAGAVAVPSWPPMDARGVERLVASAHDARAAVGLAPAAWLAPLRALDLPVDWRALPEAPGDGPVAPVAPGDPAVIQYTSGSTGDPRGVVLSHANLLANCRVIARVFGMGPGEVGVSWLPPYHDMGLVGGILAPLHVAGTMHLLSPLDFLARPVRWLRAVSRHHASISGGPDFAYALCTRRVGEEERRGLDLSTWRVAFDGAEPVRRETLDGFAAAFAPVGFRAASLLPCYGLAEATLLVSGAPDGGCRPVDVGPPGPGVTVRVVDPDTGATCADGVEGELWVAGPSVAAGYHGRPEATAARFGAHTAEGEGPFLRTGDLGLRLAEGPRAGHLVVLGRHADRIDVRGRRLHPADLEATAQARPGVRPGRGVAWGDAGGVVILQEQTRDDPQDPAVLARAIARDVARDHGVPVREVGVLAPGAVRLTPSGKPRRSATRADWEAGSLPARARVAGPDPRGAAEGVLRAVRADDAATDGRRLSELGLDSLGRVELAERLVAAVGVRVPTAVLEGDPTVATVARRLRGEPEPERPATVGPLPELSVLFFARAEEGGGDPYALVRRVAQVADREGLHAVWLPERHLHPFGGAFPEPAVLAAMLAAETRRVRLRAGSVVLPLHAPAAVVERWAMVDRLSGGRVDLAFAAGWDAASFALAPERWADRHARLPAAVDEVRALWRGGRWDTHDARGDAVTLPVLPRPVQPELAVWLTVARDPAGFEAAGRAGANVLTALLFQSREELTANIARYRAARAAAGHDPGRVTLLLHTFVAPDARARAEAPLRAYLASSVDLWGREAEVLRGLDATRRAAVVGAAADRYLGEASLVGDAATARARAAALRAAGVDEIAALVDFGLPDDEVVDGVERLAALAAGSGAGAVVDAFAPALAWEAPDRARAEGRFPWAVPMEAVGGGRVRTEGRTLLDLGSLDYLGLALHPEVRAAAAEAAGRLGATVSGSRLYGGTTPAHLRLERELAEFLGREDALVLSSGYLAVLAVLDALAGPGAVLLADAHLHASFFDAAGAARTEVRRFAHDDPDDLARALRGLAGRPVLVAVEGQYSNDGDLASLGPIRATCDRAGARLLVDDAHGVGVLGPTGRGAEEHAGLPGAADVLLGSLSKGLGSTGGWVAAPRRVVDAVRLRGRANLFSASTLGPPSVAAASAALAILRAEPGRVGRLHARAAGWRARLHARGLDTLGSVGPIVPVHVGEDERCRHVAATLLDAGVVVNPVIAPSSPPGAARLRTIATEAHTDAALDAAADAIARALGATGRPADPPRGR